MSFQAMPVQAQRGGGGTALTYSQPGGQHHAPAALPPAMAQYAS